MIRTRQVAEMLGRSEYQVREYVRRGLLTAYRPGGGRAPLCFDETDVERFRQRSRLATAGTRRAVLDAAWRFDKAHATAAGHRERGKP